MQVTVVALADPDDATMHDPKHVTSQLSSALHVACEPSPTWNTQCPVPEHAAVQFAPHEPLHPCELEHATWQLSPQTLVQRPAPEHAHAGIADAA